jgi:hypothetical protein
MRSKEMKIRMMSEAIKALKETVVRKEWMKMKTWTKGMRKAMMRKARLKMAMMRMAMMRTSIMMMSTLRMPTDTML